MRLGKALARHIAHNVAKASNILPSQVGHIVIMAEVPAGTVLLYTTQSTEDAKDWMAGLICHGMSDLTKTGG